MQRMIDGDTEVFDKYQIEGEEARIEEIWNFFTE